MRAARQHHVGASDGVQEITAAQLATALAGSRASVSPEQTAHFDEIEAAFATGGVAETAVQAAGRAVAAQKVGIPATVSIQGLRSGRVRLQLPTWLDAET